MKKLMNFLTENPSYCKTSAARVAARTGLALSTVNRFWKTAEFKLMKEDYRKSTTQTNKKNVAKAAPAKKACKA